MGGTMTIDWGSRGWGELAPQPSEARGWRFVRAPSSPKPTGLVTARMSGAMRIDWGSARVQIAGLLVLAGATIVIGYADGRFSLRTPDRQGYHAFEQQDYATAAEDFTDPRWEAVALYRQGEFERAAALFAGEDTAHGAFNQGNALVMLGRYEAAANRYARALQLKPGWENAEVNRRIALDRAKALEQKGGDMTGGQMEADEIRFEKGKLPKGADEEQTAGGESLGEEAGRAIWLRQVQTRPADFLHAKFAYQQANRETGGDQ
jgi:Ca-activated chloride channel family protein